MFWFVFSWLIWPFNTSDSETADIGTNLEPANEEFVNKDLHVQTRRVILNIYSCLKGKNRSCR